MATGLTHQARSCSGRAGEVCWGGSKGRSDGEAGGLGVGGGHRAQRPTLCRRLTQTQESGGDKGMGCGNQGH